MSTVALKGILKYDETVKQWSWNGRWVFGDTVQSDNQNSRSHKKKIVTQPFLYKWQESSTPSEISVPSLNVRIVGQQEQDDSHIVVEREEEDDEEEETTTTTTRNVDVGEEISSSADKQGKNAEGIIPSNNKIISQKQSIPNNTEGSIDTPKEGSSTTTTTVAETETLQGDPVTSSIITTDKKQDDNNSNSSSSSALTSSLQHTDGVLAQPATGSVVVDISDTSKEKTTTAAAAKKEHDSVIFNEHQTKESKSHDSKENDTKIKDSSQRNNNKERTVSSAIEIAAAAAAVKSVSTPIPFTKTIKKEQQTDSVSALSPAVVKQPNDTITNKNADDVEKKEEEEEETKKSSPVIEKSVDKIGEETTTTTINKALESSITKTDSNIVTKMITSCNTNTEKEETTVVADKKKTEQHLPSLSSSNDKKERTPSTTTISTAIVVISEEAQNKKEMTSTVAAAATTTMTIDEKESKMLQPHKFDTDTDTYSTNPPVTFSSIMPNFTEASTNDSNKDHHHCPPSGLWSGYFENTVAKKAGRQNNKNTQPPPPSQKIAETFYLFLNATPSDSSDSTTSKYSNEGNDDNDDQYYEFSKRFFAFDTATQNHIPKIIIPAAPKDEPKAPSSSSIRVEKPLPSSSTSLPPLSASTSTSTTLSNTNLRPTTAPLISLVQVRGCGKNQFGTFEIMGYLDLNTMEMEIQRQYVVTEIPAVDVSSPDTSKIRKRRSLPLSSSSDVLTEGRSSSRKRQPTWKRKSYDPEEDRRKKRPKSSPQLQQGNLTSIPLPPGTGVNPLTLTATFMENTSSALAPGEPKPPPGSISMSEGNGMASQQIVGASIQDVKTSIIGKVSKSRIALPTQSNAATSTATTNTVGVTGTKKRAVGGGSGVRVRKRPKSADSSTNPSSKSSSGSSTYIRLPPVGDPKKARWRAAHFLYYQRDDPDHLQQQQPQQQQSNGSIAGTSSNGGNITTTTNTNNKVAPPKPRYVIYEGEMVDSKRDGRGICLYNNGMLYEGEWKRNKEHGYGKLMTSDRKKIVYEGEWERGKIAGTGTYYYGSSDPIHLGSRYIGEFRENLRNGMGRYFLPDGSVYDGQWRDGSMNGLGIFTWPDGSTYDGVWKDGKRNGPGLLNNADGFRYDGQWVNNSMEGRGSAIYPNGQRYEGSFSSGRREGRGTIHFTNGAVYEGRFRDDAVDGQGTMKMSRAMVVPREDKSGDSNDADDNEVQTNKQEKQDFMIPVSFQSDMTRILTRTGFM